MALLDFCLGVFHSALWLSHTLRDKGHFTLEQAETLAEALGEATHDDLATKTDLAALKSEVAGVKAEIAGVKAELKSDIAKVRAAVAGVKAEILKWVVGAIGLQTAAMLGTVVARVWIFAK